MLQIQNKIRTRFGKRAPLVAAARLAAAAPLFALLLGGLGTTGTINQAKAAATNWDAGDGFGKTERTQKTRILPGTLLSVVKLFDPANACFYYDKINNGMRMFSGLKCATNSSDQVTGISKIADPSSRVSVYVNVPGLGLEFVSAEFKVTQAPVTIGKDLSNGVKDKVFAVRIYRDTKPPAYVEIGTFGTQDGKPNTLNSLCDVEAPGKTDSYSKVCSVHGDGKGHLMLVLDYKPYSDAFKK